MVARACPTKESSYPAHAGYPVRRGLPARSPASLEYRVTRWSLSSGAHSRDPLAGDDIQKEIQFFKQPKTFPRRGFAQVCASIVLPPVNEGAGNAGRAMGPQPRMQMSKQAYE